MVYQEEEQDDTKYDELVLVGNSKLLSFSLSLSLSLSSPSPYARCLLHSLPTKKKTALPASSLYYIFLPTLPSSSISPLISPSSLAFDIFIYYYGLFLLLPPVPLVFCPSPFSFFLHIITPTTHTQHTHISKNN